MHLHGHLPATSRTDHAGFREGLSVFLEINQPQRTVSIFNQDKHLMLQSQDLEPSGLYYLFLQLVFPECACEVREVLICD